MLARPNHGTNSDCGSSSRHPRHASGFSVSPRVIRDTHPAFRPLLLLLLLLFLLLLLPPRGYVVDATPVGRLLEKGNDSFV